MFRKHGKKGAYGFSFERVNPTCWSEKEGRLGDHRDIMGVSFVQTPVGLAGGRCGGLPRIGGSGVFPIFVETCRDTSVS